MKYLVFGGEYYYASGGVYDYIDGFDSIESAVECASESIGKYRVHESESGKQFVGVEIDWSHVFDIELKKIVHEVGGCAHNSGDMTVRLHHLNNLDDQLNVTE